MCDLATVVSSKKEGKSEEDVSREFSEKLAFSVSSIRELEKASRGQSKSDVWKRQHIRVGQLLPIFMMSMLKLKT